VGAGRGATGGSNLGGTTGACRQGAIVEVPIVVSQVPMVEIVEPDTKKIEVSWIGRGSEGEAILIENHMSRDN
jgi:hypothetical protein